MRAGGNFFPRITTGDSAMGTSCSKVRGDFLTLGFVYQCREKLLGDPRKKGGLRVGRGGGGFKLLNNTQLIQKRRQKLKPSLLLCFV